MKRMKRKLTDAVKLLEGVMKSMSDQQDLNNCIELLDDDNMENSGVRAHPPSPQKRAPLAQRPAQENPKVPKKKRLLPKPEPVFKMPNPKHVLYGPATWVTLHPPTDAHAAGTVETSMLILGQGDSFHRLIAFKFQNISIKIHEIFKQIGVASTGDVVCVKIGKDATRIDYVVKHGSPYDEPKVHRMIEIAESVGDNLRKEDKLHSNALLTSVEALDDME